MHHKGEQIEVTIADAGDDDKCFAKLEDGMSVFVQGRVAVGDRVSAEVYKVKKNYLEAKLREVLSPSASRVEPPCQHFGVCGGCKWQHVDYAAQLEQKRKHVQDALRHIGGFKEIIVEPAIAALSPYHYRNKVDFSFSNRRYLSPDEMNIDASLLKPLDFALGFHAPQRYDKAIDIDECHIATSEMNKVLETVKAFSQAKKLSVYSTDTDSGMLRNLVVRQSVHTDDLMVNLVTSPPHDAPLMNELLVRLNDALGERLTTFVNGLSSRKNTVAFSESEAVMKGDGTITERLGAYRFSISANSFFQTNTLQAERLYEKTLELARLEKSDVVYDLYCGTGSISVFISAHCAKVFGIEMVESSIRDAHANALRNGITNCRFKMLDLKDFGKMESELKEFGLPDVVITDPPRAGMHPDAVQTLLKLAPKRIVYVSCNPASLARDGKSFCDGGNYRLTEVHPVDMFPHTNHIESVAVFERL